MSLLHSAPTSLIIFLETNLTLAFHMGQPTVSFSTPDRTYTPLGSDWNGFYDWLRSDGQIVGLRQTSHESASSFQYLHALHYVVRGAYAEVEIYFSESKAYDRSESEDQSFAYNQFWLSEDKHLALAVDISACTEEERHQIEGISAIWERLQSG